MSQETNFRLTPRLVVGLLIIVLGVLFTLDNLGMIQVDAELLFSYWPVLLIAVGLAKLFGPWRRKAWFGALIWIGLGVWFLLYNLEVLTVHPFDLWTVLLVVLGIHLVIRALSPAPAKSRARIAHAARNWSSENDSSVSILALLCGLRRQLSSKSFCGGELTALMGGCEIDLREADLSQDQATLDVFALWGGIELRVPREWTVVSRVGVLMGGFEDKTDRSMASPDKRLVIRGMALMGAVEVTN